MTDPLSGMGRPSKRQVATRNEARQLRRALLDEARFGGGFDIPEDIAPDDAVFEELRRSVAFVRFIESRMVEWAPTLVTLGIQNYDDKSALQQLPTEEAAWLEVWQRERAHMLRVAKTLSDMGFDERRIALAESQADVVFTLLEKVFDALGLTEEQQARIPRIMPSIIAAVSRGDGVFDATV